MQAQVERIKEPCVQAVATPVPQSSTLAEVVVRSVCPSHKLKRLFPWFWDAVVVAYVLSGGVLYDQRIALSEHASLNQILGVIALGRLAWCLRPIRQVEVVARTTLSIAAILTLLLALRSMGTPNEDYAHFKLLSYAILVIPVLLHLELHVRNRADVARLLWITVIATATLVAFCVPAMLTMQGGERLAVLGGGPNILARHLGTGIVATLLLLKLRGRRDWKLYTACGGLGLTGLALLLTGTKAVLFSLAVAVLFACWRLGRRRVAATILATVVLATLLPLATHSLVQHYQKDGALVRLLRLPDVNDPLGSYGSRARFLAGTWDELSAAPWLGVGTGAWGMKLDLGYEDAYPHNIFLEVLGELGSIGLILVLLPLAWSRSGGGVNRRPAPQDVGSRLLGLGLATLVVFWGLNVQLSGDIVDSRFLWLWLVLLERQRRGFRSAPLPPIELGTSPEAYRS